MVIQFSHGHHKHRKHGVTKLGTKALLATTVNHHHHKFILLQYQSLVIYWNKELFKTAKLRYKEITH